MPEGDHKSCTIRGALWLVDNIADANIDREIQDAHIGSYLSRHAHYCYYGRSFTAENLAPMTVQRFRDVMASVIIKNSLQEAKKSSVDLLWEKKSDGLPQEYLLKLGYDKEIFTESDLPGPPTAVMNNSITLHSASSATGEAKRTKSLRIRVKPRNSLEHGLSTAMPSRRSQFIVVMDVEKAIANRADKYQDQATRSRAILLLIKQYKLTYWNALTKTAVELRPQQLMESLRKAFTRASTGSGHVSMANFWSDESQQARKLILVSEQEVQQ